MKISVQRYRATNKLRNSLKRQLVSSRYLLPALIVLTLVLLPCINIWQRVYVLNLVQEVSNLEKEHSKLNDLLKKAQADVVDFSRLSRVEKLAIEQLGLARVNSENMFTLRIDKAYLQPEGIDEVVHSLKKIADNLPVLTESRAETGAIFDEK